MRLGGLYADSKQDGNFLSRLSFSDELKNLVKDPDHAPLRKEMEARLEKFMRDTGDSWKFNSSAPVESTMRGSSGRKGNFTGRDPTAMIAS